MAKVFRRVLTADEYAAARRVERYVHAVTAWRVLVARSDQAHAEVLLTETWLSLSDRAEADRLLYRLSAQEQTA